MASYLSYISNFGFTKVHIWVEPPKPFDEYIFFGRPMQDKKVMERNAKENTSLDKEHIPEITAPAAKKAKYLKETDKTNHVMGTGPGAEVIMDFIDDGLPERVKDVHGPDSLELQAEASLPEGSKKVELAIVISVNLNRVARPFR